MQMRANEVMRLRLPETDRKKFAELYEKYYKLMIHVAESVLHSRAAAEDAAHTACVRILEHFSGVAAVDSPRTRSFVAIVTRNAAITAYAHAKREPAVETPPGPDSAQNPAPLPGDIAERHDAQTVLLTELHCLRPEDQDILLLKYDNGFTVAQIARALGMDEEVVKKRLQRARARLKAALEQKGYDAI